ncbi:hypothetical protein L596_017531 [Steinernema carpocapsae]|uniref:Uncharacterized protein n=1 Tax=Steinernema carpocapsae TaxID=34508 RepID=A0A4U5N1Z0_STECR|nr:hypothetical protein L596_017531 [Steinernema carpocapsae]
MHFLQVVFALLLVVVNQVSSHYEYRDTKRHDFDTPEYNETFWTTGTIIAFTVGGAVVAVVAVLIIGIVVIVCCCWCKNPLLQKEQRRDKAIEPQKNEFASKEEPQGAFGLSDEVAVEPEVPVPPMCLPAPATPRERLSVDSVAERPGQSVKSEKSSDGTIEV